MSTTEKRKISSVPMVASRHGCGVSVRIVVCDDSDVTDRLPELACTRHPFAILFRFESSRKDWNRTIV
jgi:hypothetical protein